MNRSHVIRWIWAGVLLVCAVDGASAAGILWSALDRPDRPDPVYISAGATVGGSPDWDAGTVGFNASILFRPSRAADFITALYHWNAGLVLDGEWRRLAERRDALTADLIVRKYLSNAQVGGGAALFAGFGGGLALISYPVAVTSTADPAATRSIRGEQRWWSTVVELGYESRPVESVVLTFKARWRSYVKRPYDYSSWTVHALVGVPIPW